MTLPAPRPNAGWDQLVNAFCAQRVLGMQPGREKYMRGVLRRFRFRVPTAMAGAISADAVAAYLQSRREGLAAKTVREERCVLGMFCRFLCRQGVLLRDPVADVPAPRVQRPLPHYLTDAELQQTLRLAERLGCYCEVAVAVNTGLRLGELQRLTWPDVDFAARTLRVVRAKGEKDRVVPMTDSARDALARQQRVTGACRWVFPARQTYRTGWRYVDRPRAKNWWMRALKPFQEQEDVPAFRQWPKGSTGNGWHLFRHTFASRLVQAGVDLYRVAEWLGHSDVRTTQRYAHLRPGFDAEINRADTGLDTDTGGDAVPPPPTDGGMP